MPRIAFISTHVYNYFFPGKIRQAGGQTRIYNLARAFAGRPDYDVFCITGDFGQPEVLVKDNVRLVKAPVDDPKGVLRVVTAIRSVRPDIVLDFCASPRLFLYWVFKRVTGLKYLFFTGSDNDVNGRYGTVENRFFDFFYQKGLLGADGIISQVPYHQHELKTRWDLDSYLVLSPYFDIRPFQPAEKEIILWVGRAAFYKNPELFIRLAGRFPSEQFVMICNRSGYDTRGFMKRVENGELNIGNLAFHEYVPSDEMASFYRRAKVLVNTSDFEGFPNTFIEAAVQHTPVVSLRSDPNQMLSGHQCGFACDGDMEKMAALLNRLLRDAGLQKKMGENAYRYAWHHHRLDKAVIQIDRIIRSILNPGTRLAH